jgi:hypothetical protein
MKNLPEVVHSRLENRFLRPLFGLSSDDHFPTPGAAYNEVKLFPVFMTAKRIITATQR